MTNIVSVAPVYTPPFTLQDNAAPTIGTTTISSTGKAAFVFMAPKTGNIHKVHFLCSGFTSSGGAYEVRIETIDATTGQPTGTLLAANTANVGATISAAGWQTVTLTADAAVTRGTYYAIVIKTNGANAQSWTVGNLSVLGVLPYRVKWVSSWANQGDLPIFAVEYDDASFGCIPTVYPLTALNTRTFGSGSTPDERGLYFALGYPAKLAGVRCFIDGDADWSVKLYDTDLSTVLENVAIDKDYRGGTAFATYDVWFSQDRTLAYNGAYIVSIVPTSASTMSMIDIDLPSTAVLAQFLPAGTFKTATRTDAGAWSYNTTNLPWISLILTGLDNGQSAGAGEHSYAGAG